MKETLKVLKLTKGDIPDTAKASGAIKHLFRMTWQD